MNLKYKLEGWGYVTPCPFNEANDTEIKIGSYPCRNCKDFIKLNTNVSDAKGYCEGDIECNHISDKPKIKLKVVKKLTDYRLGVKVHIYYKSEDSKKSIPTDIVNILREKLEEIQGNHVDIGVEITKAEVDDYGSPMNRTGFNDK